MKDNFENNIKESLNGFEVPYDAAAWSAMSKRLDQAMPISGKSNLKWYLGGAAIVALIASSTIFWSTNEEKPTATRNLASNTNKKVNTVQVKTSNPTATTVNTSAAKSIDQKQTTAQTTTSEINQENNFSLLDGPLSYTQLAKPSAMMNEDEPSKSVLDPMVELMKPDVPEIANMCLGETSVIKNTNKQELTILGPNGILTIKGNSTYTLSPESEGTYAIGYMENNLFQSKETFVVKPLPKADFTIDNSYPYENGVPTINLSTHAQGVAHQWSFEGQKGLNFGTETKAHFFYKGEYDISLTVTGSNSCKSTVTKSVQIDETYNLMAHNVFDPMSSDNRLNSFMPTGLAQRSVDFRMIIIDPTDGAIVFETSDVSNPWRGLDKRNGQMVSANKAYIWIATLNNPLKGENPEYKGTIVRQ